MGVSSGALTLTVSPSVLAAAPAFDATSFSGTVSSQVAQYWSGQGLSIPATGATSNVSSVLLTVPMTGLNVVDSSGQSLGQVQDFVVNTQTGQLVYAVLSGGTTGTSSPLGSNFYVVPMTVLNWQASGQGSSSSAASSAGNMGQLQATVSSSAFKSAPSVSSINQLDFSTAGWNSNIDTYWSSAK